jgi:hypothetical protein
VLHAEAYHVIFARACKAVYLCSLHQGNVRRACGVLVCLAGQSKLVALLHGSQLCLERLARTGRRRGQ